MDFYLWGATKQKVYRNKPQSLQDLRDNILHQIEAITQEEIHRVFENLKRRIWWAFPAIVVTLFLFFFNKLREGHCSSRKIDYLKYFVIDF